MTSETKIILATFGFITAMILIAVVYVGLKKWLRDETNDEDIEAEIDELYDKLKSYNDHQNLKAMFEDRVASIQLLRDFSRVE